jgi:hypothetical protein
MSEECFAFNGKAFGVRVPSKATLEDWKKKDGWVKMEYARSLWMFRQNHPG